MAERPSSSGSSGDSDASWRSDGPWPITLLHCKRAALGGPFFSPSVIAPRAMRRRRRSASPRPPTAKAQEWAQQSGTERVWRD
jgi:hypothetical protein